MTTSLSKDAGQHFTEYEEFFVDQYDFIVAMAAMWQMKENGKYIEKWMAIFSDYSFYNYRMCLTFDSEGN